MATNPATAAAVAAGLVALPSREELERLLQPSDGDTMREALARAESDFAKWEERGTKNEPAPATPPDAGTGTGPGVSRGNEAAIAPNAGPRGGPGASADANAEPATAAAAGPWAGSGLRPSARSDAAPTAPDAVSGAVPDTVPSAVPEAVPGALPDARSAAGPRAGSESGPRAGTGAGPTTDSDAKPRTGTVAGPRTGADRGAGAGERAAPDPQAGAGTRDGPGMGASAEVDAGSVADDEVSARMVMEGVPLVRRVIDQARAGTDLPSADEIAWLGLLLTSLRVRDEAWVRMDHEDLQAHIRLWKNVLTRLPEAYAAAPACLLSFAAWRSGDGALANIALDRALAADPHYTMARLLQELFISGLPPWSLRLGLTSDELDETG